MKAALRRLRATVQCWKVACGQSIPHYHLEGPS